MNTIVSQGASKVIYMRDYVGSNATQPYEHLHIDMEAARREGFDVLILNLAGSMILHGYPKPYEGTTAENEPMILPWADDSYRYYTNAVDALEGHAPYGFNDRTAEVYKL